MLRATALAALSACGLLAVPAVAAAQAPGASGGDRPVTAVAPVEQASTARQGFVIGMALGPGRIKGQSTDGTDPASLDGFSVNLHFGGMVNPRLAIVVDLWGVFHEDDQFGEELTLAHNIFTVAAKYWLSPRLWLEGGIGRGSYTVIQGSTSYGSADGPALMGAAGYELSHSRTFSLDLQLRGGAVDYEEGKLRSGAVVLGLNWF